MSTSLPYFLALGPEKFRETLSLAQAAIWHHPVIGRDSKLKHVAVLADLIEECDRKRPLDRNGIHTEDLCTTECGCAGYKQIKRTTRYTAVPVYCIEDDKTFRSVAACAQYYDTTSSAISKILRGDGKRHKGKTFTRVIPQPR